MLSKHFRVLVPEQRGRGRSDYDDDVSRYALLQYVEDMRGLLSDLGIEQCGDRGDFHGRPHDVRVECAVPGTGDPRGDQRYRS